MGLSYLNNLRFCGASNTGEDGSWVLGGWREHGIIEFSSAFVCKKSFREALLNIHENYHITIKHNFDPCP